MSEQWKTFYIAKANYFQVKKYPDAKNIWQVSNEGEIRIVNSITEKIKYPNLGETGGNQTGGYLAISINNAPEKYVHRLVAKYFVHNPDPEVKTTVNHIDGNKFNNHADNLEWCSYKEQTAHALMSGLRGNMTGEEAAERLRQRIEQREMEEIQRKLRKLKEIEDEFMALMCKCDAGSIQYRICALRAAGYAYKDIATELNIPLSTVKNKIHRLRNK